MLAVAFKRTSGATCRLFSTIQAREGQIGFIGLGNMGGHMVANLLKQGHAVVVSDLNQEALDKATALGAQTGTLQEIARHCRCIITMLPSSPNVQAVHKQLMPDLAPGALLIDSSTIDPTVSKELADAWAAKGCAMVDAPVSGGVGGAEGGTLTFMVGGPELYFESSKRILEAMGANFVHCGEEVGSGQVVKLCNNLVLGISMTAVSEGMNLGVKRGIDPKLLASVFNTSTARCWSTDTYNPCPGVMPTVPASKDYEGGFGVDLMRKDLGLALEAAKTAGVPLPLGTHTHELYGKVSESGAGKKDFSYMYKYLSNLFSSSS